MEHHILTVGVSLLQNFARSQTPPADLAFAQTHHRKVWSYLIQHGANACAEIQSLHMRTGFLNSPPSTDLAVTLVFTETSAGKCAASLLEKFLKHHKIRVDKIPVKGFDKPARDFDPDFARQEAVEALTHMRERITRHIGRLKKRTPDLKIELNITGGYKAETAVLYELGRTLSLPVYYLHETFNSCVTLP